MKKNASLPRSNKDINLTIMAFVFLQKNKVFSPRHASIWKRGVGHQFARLKVRHITINNSLFFLLLMSALSFSPITYADIQITGVRKGQTALKVYTEPSAAAKKGTIAVDQIKELAQGKTLEVIDQAVNGRYLKVIINGEALWIKAKQVKTTQTFDVGSCEQSKALTGVRGAVNCTK